MGWFKKSKGNKIMQVIKKDGTIEEFDKEKIINAVKKSASRCTSSMLSYDYDKLLKLVDDYLLGYSIVKVAIIHDAVIKALYKINSEVAETYSHYHNYKTDFVKILDETYKASQAIRYIGDKENSNTDSALVATKRCLIFNELNKRLYRKFFMRHDELDACKDGYIYIHDQSARLDTINCFERSTRFITSTGVKSFYDFSDGDEIIVLSHTGKWRKAVVHSYGWQKIQKVTFKRGSGKEKSVLVTPNHRWILKDGSETTSLKVGDKLISAPCVSKFEWNELSRKDKKLWCLGFGLGDGSIISDNKMPTMHIRLFGHKKEYANMFTEAGYNVTSPKSLNGALEVRMTDVRTKELPYLQLNNENIKYLMNGYLCADGNINHGLSDFRGVQVTGNMNKHIYDLLNIAGYYVTSVKDLTGQVTNYGIRAKNTKSYQIHSNQGDRTWKVKSIEDAKLNPKAKVWCLDVEVDHSFILENGIPTGNCCLFDVASVMHGGFEMGNIHYNEPKTLDTAFDVLGDIILSCASQQYGGFTVPEIDKILKPYAEKSYTNYRRECLQLCGDLNKSNEWAMSKVKRDFEQGYQGLEMKLNSVGSSRGDYPFITISFGLGTEHFERMCTQTILEVHAKGQGADGHKKPVLFPKLVFLYDSTLHGEGYINNDLFECALKCSSKTMYPDYLSLERDEIYQKYGVAISPMGCRAFLSPYFDENGKPVFVGRFNMGVVSLHLPMILAKARKENKDFYEVLDFYLEMIRRIHKRTIDYLGEMRASTNPVGFCEGGFYGGHLKPSDKIKPVLKAMTISFGITALNELQRLYNGKSLVEDGAFALEVMEHINRKIEQYKKEDGILYAIYGTPAESLCGKQVEQFRKLYGIVEGVSDRAYVSNSFHCHVTEDISPIMKQDLEERFWHLFKGGRIQYVRYPLSYNIDAIRTLVTRAMKKGFYEGVNMALAYCDDCGADKIEGDVCPVCGSKNLTKIDRMNGYLSYSRVKGDTRLNSAKMAEIADRKSM
jgi:ribonucleoside-triphosphate reductase